MKFLYFGKFQKAGFEGSLIMKFPKEPKPKFIFKTTKQLLNARHNIHT
jgi:hypothetical protein